MPPASGGEWWIWNAVPLRTRDFNPLLYLLSYLP